MLFLLVFNTDCNILLLINLYYSQQLLLLMNSFYSQRLFTSVIVTFYLRKRLLLPYRDILLQSARVYFCQRHFILVSDVFTHFCFTVPIFYICEQHIISLRQYIYIQILFYTRNVLTCCFFNIVQTKHVLLRSADWPLALLWFDA